MSVPRRREHLNKQNLLDLVKTTFREILRPDHDKIIGHDCDECKELRDDLFNHNRFDVPLDVISLHARELPLLTPEARRYFLPSYLLRAIETGNIGIIESIIFHLYTEDFDDQLGKRYCMTFSTGERRAVCAFLNYVSRSLRDEFGGDKFLIHAKKIWCRN